MSDELRFQEFISQSLGRATTAKEREALRIVFRLLKEAKNRMMSEKFDSEQKLKKLTQEIEIMNMDEATFRYLESLEQ